MGGDHIPTRPLLSSFVSVFHVNYVFANASVHATLMLHYQAFCSNFFPGGLRQYIINDCNETIIVLTVQYISHVEKYSDKAKSISFKAKVNHPKWNNRRSGECWINHHSQYIPEEEGQTKFIVSW